MSRISVTIVTGFLGSGKTTLLNALLKHPEMTKAAVVVNEFGEIGIDYDLVERSDETIIQLENGCLCCTVKGDLIDTFRDLYLQRKGGKVPWFDRVVIETTGIADPGPVLQIILTDPMVSTAYQLDGIVTTVDSVSGAETLDRFPESVKQVAVADRIILTKTDLVEGGDRDAHIAAIGERLRGLNPAAPVIAQSPKTLEPGQIFAGGMLDPEANALDAAALDPEIYKGQPAAAAGTQAESNAKTIDEARAYYAAQGHEPGEDHEHNHDPLIRSFCVVREEPLPIDTLRLFLDGLAREAGPDLLRVKGIVNIEERPDTPAVIQGAQQIFHSLDWLDAWPSDDQRTRIVFITRGIEQEHIEDTLAFVVRMSERTRAAAAGVA